MQEPREPERPGRAETQPVEGVGVGDFQSQWSHDLGEADPSVRAALSSGNIHVIMAALVPSRLFIALVAEISGDPSEGDKNSDMSVACLLANDGRLGLLCFTGLDSLSLWNPRARPVPISAPDAAEAALDENAQAIIVDLAGENAATLTLADIVKLSNRDQRARAVLLLRELLGEVGEQVVFVKRTDGVLQVEVPEFLLEKVERMIQTNVALHSFVPAGIAICVQGSGQTD